MTDKKDAKKAPDNNQYEQLAAVAENSKETLGVFQQVGQKYIEAKDLVVEFSKEHVKDVGPTLSNFGQYLEGLATNAHSSIMRFLETMAEQRDISSPNYVHISNLFVTSIIYLVISGIGQFIGSYLAVFILSYFFLNFGVFLLVTIVVPTIAYFYFNNFDGKSWSDANRRGLAACFVLEQAILIGYMNHNHYFDAPYAILTQVTFSFAYPFALSRSANRLQVFGSVAGLSIGLNLVQGMWGSSLSFGFILIAAIYAILGVGLIQYTLEFRQKVDFDDIQVTMYYTFMISAVKMIGLCSFGVPSNQYNAHH